MFEGFTTTKVKTDGATIHVLHGGRGPAVLLLHGYPQTHVMWHKVAPRLAERYTVVCPDLRGYGDSSKPPDGENHAGYSKRATAKDQVQVMAHLGFEEFFLVGHDRGARVAHRLTLDHPERVKKLALLDIVPTYKMFTSVGKELATANYHWFFLIQPAPLPEKLIGEDPEYWVKTKLERWAAAGAQFDPEAVAAYVKAFRNPAAIHATCEDYRAAATIDLAHDEADLERRITCPLLVLWGGKGRIDRLFDVIETWRERARDVRGKAIACGHFLAEEAPTETAIELQAFLVT